jgi:hypothetical protein
MPPQTRLATATARLVLFVWPQASAHFTGLAAGHGTYLATVSEATRDRLIAAHVGFRSASARQHR